MKSKVVAKKCIPRGRAKITGGIFALNGLKNIPVSGTNEFVLKMCRKR